MNIPFFIHAPNVAGEVVEQVGGQVDMLPTVLNLLGITEKGSELIIFGSDLLNVTTNIVGARYYLPTGSFLMMRYSLFQAKALRMGRQYH